MPYRLAETRITSGLFLAHALGSAGAIAVGTVAAIVGAELSGRTWLAGFPGAAFQLGGAGTALLVAWLVTRFGRRRGLAVAGVLGTLGMATASIAMARGAFAPFLMGLIVAGTGSAAVRFARFTAAEVAPRERRARAVAIVVTGGTVGSVLGPALVAPSGVGAAALGWNPLDGPFLAAAALFGLATLAFFVFLRPDPSVLAARLHSPGGPPLEAAPPRPWRVLLRDPGVRTAIVTLVLSQAVMVMLMGITSLHMHAHDHALSLISLVFSGHTLGMFAFSVVSGWAADRFGRIPVMIAGGGVLAVSCLLAPLSPTFVPLFVALFLLGYGWNLAYVAGSAMLTDFLSVHEKSATQGVTDLLMGLVSAAATLVGGVVFATVGFAAMSLAGLVASLAMLGVLLHARRALV